MGVAASERLDRWQLLGSLAHPVKSPDHRCAGLTGQLGLEVDPASGHCGRAASDQIGGTDPLQSAPCVPWRPAHGGGSVLVDVGGLHRIDGTPARIAERLRERVRREVGLPITVGVARSKFLAKVASAVGKPDGLLVVAPGTELQFLHPLPVRRLWGVGPKTEARLHEAGIATVGQMAELGEHGLSTLLGRGTGRHLYALSLAHDPRRIDTGRRRKSIGAQRALGRRMKSEAEIEATALAIVDRLGERLRAAGRVTRTVELRLRFDDFTSITRSRSLREPTDSTEIVLATARGLLDEAMPLIRDRGCTLIGLSLANLENHGAVQLTLPFDGGEHDADLDIAMDELRTRFGRAAVTRGSLLHRPLGPDAPMLAEQD